MNENALKAENMLLYYSHPEPNIPITKTKYLMCGSENREHLFFFCGVD